VKHVDTIFNYFVIKIGVNDELSLFMLESGDSLSLSSKKKIENDENKI
jgi:hypothetical protein